MGWVYVMHIHSCRNPIRNQCIFYVAEKSHFSSRNTAVVTRFLYFLFFFPERGIQDLLNMIFKMSPYCRLQAGTLCDLRATDWMTVTITIFLEVVNVNSP